MQKSGEHSRSYIDCIYCGLFINKVAESLRLPWISAQSEALQLFSVLEFLPY